jgi:hypothetical protein
VFDRIIRSTAKIRPFFKKNYVPLGTDCPSVGVLKCTSDYIEIGDEESKGKKKKIVSIFKIDDEAIEIDDESDGSDDEADGSDDEVDGIDDGANGKDHVTDLPLSAISFPEFSKSTIKNILLVVGLGREFSPKTNPNAKKSCYLPNDWKAHYLLVVGILTV